LDAVKEDEEENEAVEVVGEDGCSTGGFELAVGGARHAGAHEAGVRHATEVTDTVHDAEREAAHDRV